MFKQSIASIAIACGVLSYTHVACAAAVDKEPAANGSYLLNLDLPESARAAAEDRDDTVTPLLIAATDSGSSSGMVTMEEKPEGKYEDRIFTGNKIHKYLGIGSIGAALLTLIAPKEEDGAHEYLAKTSAVLGVGAVATGLSFHYEDVSMEGGFRDPDNLHALWAGLGAVGIAMAASTGPDTPHATYGSLGAIGMMIGIRYTW